MAIRKFQSVEKVEVVSPDGHKVIETELHKIGKTSMKDVPVSERPGISRKLDK